MSDGFGGTIFNDGDVFTLDGVQYQAQEVCRTVNQCIGCVGDDDGALCGCLPICQTYNDDGGVSKHLRFVRKVEDQPSLTPDEDELLAKYRRMKAAQEAFSSAAEEFKQFMDGLR